MKTFRNRMLALLLAAMVCLALPMGAGASASGADDRLAAAEARILKSWLSYEETTDLEACHLSASECKALMQKLIYVYPRFFYVENNYSYSYNSTTEDILSLRFRYTGTQEEIEQQLAAYDQALRSFLEPVDADWSQAEKVLYLHDMLVQHVAYDETYEADTAYDALVGGSSTCVGYSLAFKDLLGALGMQAYLVGSDTLRHAWNAVSVDGTYYYVDTTWDDPTPDQIGRCNHSFVLLSADALRANGHNSTDWIHYGAPDDLVVQGNRYDTGMFWQDSRSVISPYGDQWVSASQSDGLALYAYHDDVAMAATTTIRALPDIWYLWGTSTQRYSGTLASCDVYGNRIYYSTPHAVYSVLADATGLRLEYALTAEEREAGDLYGMKIDGNGQMTYSVGTDYREAPAFVRTVSIIKTNTVEPYSTGDCNGNGVVDGDDATLVLRYYAQSMISTPSGFDASFLQAADVDGSGAVDSDDAVRILKFYTYVMIHPDAVWTDLYAA